MYVIVRSILIDSFTCLKNTNITFSFVSASITTFILPGTTKRLPPVYVLRKIKCTSKSSVAKNKHWYWKYFELLLYTFTCTFYTCYVDTFLSIYQCNWEHNTFCWGHSMQKALFWNGGYRWIPAKSFDLIRIYHYYHQVQFVLFLEVYYVVHINKKGNLSVWYFNSCC